MNIIKHKTDYLKAMIQKIILYKLPKQALYQHKKDEGVVEEQYQIKYAPF